MNIWSSPFSCFRRDGLAVFVLRRRAPDVARPYRAWGFPVVPVVFIAMSLAVFASIVASQPLKSLAGAGLLAAGVPVYLVWKGRRGRAPSFGTKRDSP
jgi:APA family basic amino acid/polyamine antiporter